MTFLRTLAVALLALAALGPAGAPAEALSRVRPFGHAYAHHACGPADGPAFRVVFRREPVLDLRATAFPATQYPRLDVTIWQAPPIRRWLAIAARGTRMPAGRITRCRSAADCEDLEGRLRFERFTPTWVEGELRVTNPRVRGGEEVYPFAAPVLPIAEPCG